jgi:hypothetical protein
MRVIKAFLPEGVKKRSETRIGKKVKVVNKLYCKPKKAKAESK